MQATETPAGQTDSSMGLAIFAFKKESYSDNAELFIFYYYDVNLPGSSNRISIQINNISTYKLFMSRLKTLSYKLADSEIKNGDIIKVYKNNTTTVEIRTFTKKENFITNTAYDIFICNPIDYKKYLKESNK